MNLSAIKNIAPKAFGRSTMVVRKYSPEILTGLGAVGVVATAVMTGRATLKLEPIVDKIDERKELSKGALAKDEITPAEYNKELAAIYVKGGLDMAKLYGPAITMGLASITCIVSAHGIMRRRNVALAAAYKAVETSFNEYKKRVEEELGTEQERDIRAGVVETEEKDVETGKKKSVAQLDPNKYSIYARCFDRTNKYWESVPEYNLMHLKAQQNYANDLLHSRGHVFLNEVYDMLGFERTQAGQAVGWVLNEGGDNFVDFGIWDLKNEAAREFVNGYEEAIFLDFNVDGTVWDKI